MTEVAFWILTALAGGRQHGYGILRDADELSDGAVKLRVTTLYTSLDRLERDGRIQRAGEETVDGRARRYYELTPAGRTALEVETKRLLARARAAEKRLATPPTAALRPGTAGMSAAVAW
ncbi:PadR family transcriptional regulator [Pseudoclavibacter sp. AY1F1]|uniref:PadR family transcriptional regulator n=1 Tax=Pseudoclavibacter sp. AY1F1 TaxID=2080583 RepID=UPI000CE8183C|nr:helix-turn-helix transcriptional regulator [Pseudoclavibacter sp. AY1F1]PPF45907.1 PadR family transcriptional regulator [Pseudoclavibacter sp. AY1F1]